MEPARSLPPLFLVCLLSVSSHPAQQGRAPEAAGVRVEEVHYGRVTWGRNTLRLRFRNEGSQAATLAVRIRSRFVDSGSGVIWERSAPALLPPADGGDSNFDFWVRPDHGLLRLELRVSDATGKVIREESREFTFPAPYRGDYVLQPYTFTGGGIAWDARILPAFRIRESQNFIFYFFPRSEAESDIKRIATSREKILRELSRELGVMLPSKAVYFLYSDPEVARKLTGHRSDGWAYGTTIVEVYNRRRKIDPRHEIVHLLASRIGTPPALFAEGLATAWEANFDNAGRYRTDAEAWCRGLLQEGALLPLSELMGISSLGESLTRPRIAYPESACFIRYLLASQGWGKVRQAYAVMVDGPDPVERARNEARFERIFGVSLREAESAWKQDLSQSRGPGVPPEVVRSAVREEEVPYLLARARLLLAAKSAEEAEPILRSALELESGSVDAHFLLGQACHLQEKYEVALKEYGETIRLGDRTTLTQIAWSRVWSGQILDRLGRRQEALSQYRQAVALGDTGEVLVEGRLTTAQEAAQEGMARPFGEAPE